MSNSMVVDNQGHVVHAETIISAKKADGEVVPFALASDGYQFNHPVSLNILNGPRHRGPAAIGVANEEPTLSFKDATIDPAQLRVVRDVELSIVEAIDDPEETLALTAAGADGNLGVGYLAVAQAYRTPFGTTKVGPVQTVNLSANQHAAVTSLADVPADASVDWYVSKTVGETADAAALLPLFYLENNDGSAFNITAHPGESAAPAPVYSSIGADMTQAPVGGQDSVLACDILVECSEDGSNFKRLFFGCVSTQLGDSVGSAREFVKKDFAFTIAGRISPDTGLHEFYRELYSGDRT